MQEREIRREITTKTQGTQRFLFNLIEKNEIFVFFLCELCVLCGEIPMYSVEVWK